MGATVANRTSEQLDEQILIVLSQHGMNHLMLSGNKPDDPASLRGNVTDHDADMKSSRMVRSYTDRKSERGWSSRVDTRAIFSHLGARDSSRVKRPENSKIKGEYHQPRQPQICQLKRPDAVMDDLILVGISQGNTSFEGVDLHKACLRAGLRRTEAQVYQRFPLDETDTPLFSLVNGVEPGTFECDANAIDTNGISLY